MDRYWQYSWSSCSRTLGTLATLIVVSGCEPAPDELVRRYIDASNRHDLEAAAALWTPGLIDIDRLTPGEFGVGTEWRETRKDLVAMAEYLEEQK